MKTGNGRCKGKIAGNAEKQNDERRRGRGTLQYEVQKVMCIQRQKGCHKKRSQCGPHPELGRYVSK